MVGCTSQEEYDSCTYEKDDLQQEINVLKNKTQELVMVNEELDNFHKNYNKATKEYMNGLFDMHLASYQYSMWSYYYTNDYLDLAITNCEAARDLYTSSNSYYQKGIQYFKIANETAPEEYGNLITTYVLASELIIDVNWEMYEACEYFEIAAGAYLNDDFDTGDSELEIANSKIRKHDNMVKEYNGYIAKIKVLEESI